LPYSPDHHEGRCRFRVSRSPRASRRTVGVPSGFRHTVRISMKEFVRETPGTVEEAMNGRPRSTQPVDR
jgi:hypothetical protein